MRKYLALFLIVCGSLLMVTSAAADQPTQEHKVTICHRTNSDTNPYVQITVDKSAADGVASKKGPADHYGEHQGPIWNDTLKDQKIEWGDIIPPIDGFHDGLNWTEEGQAIYRDGCDVEGEVTTTTVDETTTTTEGTTTTTEGTTTTTEGTTTTTEGTTTTVETTTTVGIDGSSTTAPDTSAPPKRPAIGPAGIEQLPVTGSNENLLLALGAGLTLSGALLTAGSRRAMVR